MHIEPEVFYRFDPSAAAVPVVVDVSRSGRFYPIDFRSPVPFSALHDNVSMYVDEIWKHAPQYGATMLQALFPNTYIDANRHELDIDPSLIEGEWPVPVQFVSKSGLGLLKTVSRYGEPLQERKLTVAEVQHRLDRYFHPYHRELASVMDRMLTAHGFYYQLSCHCMSAVGAPTHADAGKERMDFCLGNLRGTSSTADFIEFIAEVIRAQGFTCSVNTPYTGGELNRRYGNADGTRESVMVEINKRTFLDVKTFKKNGGFDAVQNVARAVLQAVTQRARERIGAIENRFI
jgi:N-formylglutamate amidohydrolase